MSSIVTNKVSIAKKQLHKCGERKLELVNKIKYYNNLPDIPYDLKSILYSFDSKRFAQYHTTSLERNYQFEILNEQDGGVEIDLINPDTYSEHIEDVELHPTDEKLLEEEIVVTPQDSKKSRHHARNVSWLRRTEYISTEQTRFQPRTMDKVEAQVGYSIKKKLRNETLYMDRDSQIKAIDNTFEAVKKPINTHYSKPNVVPVEILPIYPDFKNWKYPYAQVIFDSDPAPVGKQKQAQIEIMSHAIIRGVMDEFGDQFVAYFLPTEETLINERKHFINGIPSAEEQEEEEENFEYKMTREYNWNVKNKACKGYEENYFFIVQPEAVYYNELETRVRLIKRRQKIGHECSVTKLIIKCRPINEIEFKMQRFREKQLEPSNDDDEEIDTCEDQDNNNVSDKEKQIANQEVVNQEERENISENINQSDDHESRCSEQPNDKENSSSSSSSSSESSFSSEYHTRSKLYS